MTSSKKLKISNNRSRQQVQVWFQLFDATTKLPYKGHCATKLSIHPNADVDDFRKGIIFEDGYNGFFNGILSSTFLVYKNKAVFDADGQLLRSSDSLHKLKAGKDEDNALAVVVPREQPFIQQIRTVGAQFVDQTIVLPSNRKVFCNSSFVTDGLNPNTNHFDRDDVVEKMFKYITGDEEQNRLLLLNSPPASGKTSLLVLFQNKYPSINTFYMSLKDQTDPLDSLSNLGFDFRKRLCYYDQVIFMLDDAQYQYNNTDFWDLLINDVPLLFGSGVRFIIAATHLISPPDQSSHTSFRSLETIHREELLLSDDNALKLLDSHLPLGLPSYMHRYLQLKHTIIEHCNGLIGALCISLHFFSVKCREQWLTEFECLQLFYSKQLVDRMDRCFGLVSQLRMSKEANDALLKFVLGERIHSIRVDDDALYSALASFCKLGILKMDKQLYYVFSSLLAKRYFTRSTFSEIAPRVIRPLFVIL
jgi:hypothetical protein